MRAETMNYSNLTIDSREELANLIDWGLIDSLDTIGKV